MNEKPIAILLATAVVVALCLLCALGPVALVSAAALAGAWLGGLSPMTTTAFALFAGLFAYALLRRWGPKRPGQEGDNPHE